MKRIVSASGNLNWKWAYAVLVLCTSTSIALPAQWFFTLHSFDNTDGAGPFAGLVQPTNGDLYGTAVAGGANNTGTIFKITPSGTLTTLYAFCSQATCTDGEDSQAGLVQATDGDLYGTTVGGGANKGGTIFKITPGGTLTTLHSFCSPTGCTDGATPSGLVQAANRDL